MKKINYAEPADYFPKSIRKKFGLGEYNKDVPAGESEKLLRKDKRSGKTAHSRRKTGQ